MATGNNYEPFMCMIETMCETLAYNSRLYTNLISLTIN